LCRSMRPMQDRTKLVALMDKEDRVALEFLQALCHESWYTKPLPKKKYLVLLQFATKYDIPLMVKDCSRLCGPMKKRRDSISKQCKELIEETGMTDEELTELIFEKKQ